MLRNLTVLLAAVGIAFAMTAEDACPCPMAEAAPAGSAGAVVEADGTEAATRAEAEDAAEVPPCHRPAADAEDAAADGEDAATTNAEQAHAHGSTPCPCEHDDDNPTCCCPGCPAAHGDPSTPATLHLEAALPRAPEVRAALHAQPSPAAGPRAPDAHVQPPHASLPAVRPPPPPPDSTADLTVQLQVFRI